MIYIEVGISLNITPRFFSGNSNILGFEFINEPPAGNLYKSPAEFLDLFGISGHKYLEPLYHSLAKDVWDIDPDRIVVFESSTNSPFTTGFFEAPGGRKKASRQILSHHVYCPLVDWSGCPKVPKVCPIFDEFMMYVRYMEAQHFNCGLLLTEFGALSQDQSCVNETHAILSIADNLGEGWIYWQYKQFDDPTTANMDKTQGFYDIKTGKLHQKKVMALSRPYARLIAGRVISMNFDYQATNRFTLKYKASSESMQRRTEIYLNNLYYKQKDIVKFVVKVNPEGAAVCTTDDEVAKGFTQYNCVHKKGYSDIIEIIIERG